MAERPTEYYYKKAVLKSAGWIILSMLMTMSTGTIASLAEFAHRATAHNTSGGVTRAAANTHYGLC